MKRFRLALVGTIFIAIAAFGIASAHARLDHCTPAVGSTAATPPSQVVCVYSEEIDTRLSTMSVWDSNGNQVDKKDGHVDLKDPDHKTLIVSLDPSLTKNGLFTVKWHTVTPDDGGISDGSWQFVVGSAPATPYPPTEIAQGETPSAARTPAAGGNAPEVIAPAPSPSSPTPSAPSSGPAAGGPGSSALILIAIVAVVIIAGAAIALARR